MATHVATKILWRMCPVVKYSTPTKLVPKRNMGYSHKLIENSLNSPRIKGKTKSLPARKVHQSSNNSKMNKNEDDFVDDSIPDKSIEEAISFKEGVRYELCDSKGEKSQEYFNVVDYLSNMEKGRQLLFPHLQPANQRPVGAFSVNYDTEITRMKPVSVVYPQIDSQNFENKHKQQQGRSKVVQTVGSTGKLSDVNKKNYTTSAKDTYTVSKTKALTDIPVVGANYSKIAEILQKTYNSDYDPAIKKICSITSEAGPDKKTKLLCKSKTKLKFSINSPRNMRSSRQNLLSCKKSEKNTDKALIGQSKKNYNTSATDNKKNIEYVKLCTAQTEKKLPKIETSACPPPGASPKMTSFKLKPLKKPENLEPPKTRPCEPTKSCQPRADDNLKFKPKELPKLAPSICSRVEPTPLKDVPPLKPLKKPVASEPPKIRPCEPTKYCQPRADDSLEFKPKELPKLTSSTCSVVEPTPLKDAPPLKRLNKVPIVQKRVCPDVQTCRPRADDSLQIEKKKLPNLPESPCVCVEPETLKDIKPLKRLPKTEVKEPGTKVCVQEKCPPRADYGLTIDAKTLPNLPITNCPCIEPEPMKDAPPLKRLTKGEVVVPERICPKEECPVKQQEIIEQKFLPKIEFSDCPQVETTTPQSAPTLKRLEKVDIPEPKKECTKESCEQNLRADRDCWAFIKSPNLTNTENESHGKRNYSTCTINTEESVNDSQSTTPKNLFVNPIDFVNSVIYKLNSRQIGSTQNPTKDEDCPQPNKPIIREKGPFVSSFDKTDLKQIKNFQFCNKNEMHEDQSDNVCFREKCQEETTKPVREPKCPTVCQNIEPKRSAVQQNIEPKWATIEPKCPTTCQNIEPKWATAAPKCSTTIYQNMQPKCPTTQPKCPTTYQNMQPKYPSAESKCSTTYQNIQPRCPTVQPKSPISQNIQPKCPTTQPKCPTTSQNKQSKCPTTQPKCQSVEIGYPTTEPKCPTCPNLQPSACPDTPMWQKIVNYFKARPGCPTPEELRMKRLREKAEKAAKEAGLSIYDPRECGNSYKK